MKSQTSLVAEKVRLQEWALQVQDCQNRPHGLSVDDWCKANQITRANYYYRLRRVRETCLKALPVEHTPAFVELSMPAEAPVLETLLTQTPPAVITTPEGLRIELSEHASDVFLQKLIGAVCHVK